jgi:hypothetical protein
MVAHFTFAVVKVVAVATVLALAVESFGRKKCLITGGLIQAATMLWIAGYQSLHHGTKIDGAGYVSLIAGTLPCFLRPENVLIQDNSIRVCYRVLYRMGSGTMDCCGRSDTERSAHGGNEHRNWC